MKLLSQIKFQVKQLKQECLALYYAYRDMRTPWYAKAIIAVTVAYLLSPIDLIPDFIPILGYLDDLVLVPILIKISIRLIPDEVMEQSRKKAASQPIPLRKNWIAAVAIIAAWVITIVLILYRVWKR